MKFSNCITALLPAACATTGKAAGPAVGRPCGKGLECQASTLATALRAAQSESTSTALLEQRWTKHFNTSEQHMMLKNAKIALEQAQTATKGTRLRYVEDTEVFYRTDGDVMVHGATPAKCEKWTKLKAAVIAFRDAWWASRDNEAHAHKRVEQMTHGDFHDPVTTGPKGKDKQLDKRLKPGNDPEFTNKQRIKEYVYRRHKAEQMARDADKTATKAEKSAKKHPTSKRRLKKAVKERWRANELSHKVDEACWVEKDAREKFGMPADVDAGDEALDC